jgi:hypothetical protein
MPTSFTPLPRPKDRTDKVREARIQDEIIADAYDDDEVLSGWYHYLEEKLRFPFQAYVNMENPEQINLKILVTVLRLADIRLCSTRCIWLVVHVRNSSWYFYIPVSEIMEVKVDKKTVQTLADWIYWSR